MAINCYQKYLKIHLKTLGPDHPITKITQEYFKNSQNSNNK